MIAMICPSHAKCLGPGPDPLAVAAGWPIDRPLAALLSARGGSPHARWSILTTPKGSRTLKSSEYTAENGLQEALDGLIPPKGRLDSSSDPACPPFRGGTLLVLPYELGRALEPRATHPARPAVGDTVLATALECPTALVHDRMHGHWWLVGPEPAAEALLPCLEHAVPPTPGAVRSTPLRPTPDDAAYAELVRRTVDYVHAGDIFQANITRRFKAGTNLPTIEARRRFATSLLATSGAWFGAIIEPALRDDGRMIISLSPELFLEVSPHDDRILTRPIKGTLPAGSEPEELHRSEKDAAELAMIVDLMRNDLGRICRPGSVRVTEPRTIERHPSVIHGVAEVTGTLRDGVGFGELLASTFPPGSVSGAPKIRAMQVIEELEPEARGIYCGALGYASNCGHLQLDVSIRTLDLEPVGPEDRGFSHELRYGAGCGIVAESTPAGEVAESHVKADLLRDFLATGAGSSDREDLGTRDVAEIAER